MNFLALHFAAMVRALGNIIFIFRPTVHNKLKEQLGSLTKSLKKRLQDIETISTTLDIWSDRAMRGFMAVTGHFIEGNTLKSALIGVHHFKSGYCSCVWKTSLKWFGSL